MLVPPKPGSALYRTAIEQTGLHFPLLNFWKDVPMTSTPMEDLLLKRQYRAPKDAVDALRSAAQQYEGSHKFHNFTVGHEFTESQSQRYMKKIEVRLMHDSKTPGS